ncbi:Helix-turn-helix domain containing protein [uncultured Caudovirales phage]|uniref:Helix-turn-helix domain containing protein n=1 Tax=uncultured Caudovirales phage TaxID=2100421 RepID=A0A6J5KLG3_9CAUD|nr:Helix-turn-helix domain containing protein [uncultured Caudovirales phage]
MTQQAAIIQCLKKGWKSPLDALKEAGTMKLSTRVGELRQAGFVIQSKWHESKKYKIYRIVKQSSVTHQF